MNHQCGTSVRTPVCTIGKTSECTAGTSYGKKYIFSIFSVIDCWVIRGSDVKVPVLFVESTLQHQLLKVDEGHRDGDGLHAAVLPNAFHFSLQTVRQSHKVKDIQTSVNNCIMY